MELKDVQVDVIDQQSGYGVQCSVVAEIVKIVRSEQSYTIAGIRDFTGTETNVLIRGRTRPQVSMIGKVGVFKLAGATKGKYVNYSGFFNPTEEVPAQYQGKRPPRPSGGTQGGGGKSSGGNVDPAKNRGVSLSYAKDLAVAGKIDIKDIPMYAKAFTEYVATGVFPQKQVVPPTIPVEQEIPEMGEQTFHEEGPQDFGVDPYAINGGAGANTDTTNGYVPEDTPF